MSTPRTPSPKQRDPKAEVEQSLARAYAKQLKAVADHFAKAAMEVQAAAPGTIGRQRAEVRAKACRKALEGTVATLVKRERLDAHAHSYARVEAYIESLVKHEQLGAADAKVLERAARKINGVVKEMRLSVELQRNALDDSVEN